MKKLFIFAFVALLRLTACQATPDAPIVVQKDYVHGDDDLLRATLSIDRIQLELQRVTEENAIEYGLVIPVWNFYGEYISEYEWATFSSKPPYDLPGALLTINAVDGSVIDPQKGY